MLNRIGLAIMQDDNSKHSKWPDKIDGIYWIIGQEACFKKYSEVLFMHQL